MPTMGGCANKLLSTAKAHVLLTPIKICFDSHSQINTFTCLLLIRHWQLFCATILHYILNYICIEYFVCF